MAIKKVMILIFAVCASGCAAVKLAGTNQADAERGALKFPGYTFSDLNRGKQIYVDHCNKCHRYKAPQTRDESRWDAIIPKMAKKAKLNGDEQELVLKYVVAMSTVKVE
jgi:hypothetical protein